MNGNPTMIVLEGPDGGGKSTLAQRLSENLEMKIVPSEGPEKYDGEIDERIMRYHMEYAGRHNILFDRHPCVSQMAYSLVHQQSKPNEQLVNRFYQSRPLLIYCRPDPSNVRHEATGEWDTKEYLAKVDKNYGKLMQWYDVWASWHANYIYRIGDPMSPLERLIEGWRAI